MKGDRPWRFVKLGAVLSKPFEAWRLGTDTKQPGTSIDVQKGTMVGFAMVRPLRSLDDVGIKGIPRPLSHQPVDAVRSKSFHAWSGSVVFNHCFLIP